MHCRRHLHVCDFELVHLEGCGCGKVCCGHHASWPDLLPPGVVLHRSAFRQTDARTDGDGMGWGYGDGDGFRGHGEGSGDDDGGRLVIFFHEHTHVVRMNTRTCVMLQNTRLCSQ